MRKNLLITAGILLLSLLFFPACQKDIGEPTVKDKSEDAVASESTANRNNKDNSCRLVTLDWSAGGYGIWQYQYNRKGLADRWAIDYGDGVVLDEKIYYNRNDQIIKADEDFFGSPYVYRFFYTGKRLTRLTRTSVEFPDQVQDFRFTYNHKGQNTRQDDVINDEHVLMYYDALGNCTKTDIYLGSDLWYSDIYTFNDPVRNPWLHVPGIEYGFLAYGGTYAGNKRWFTSNLAIIYDTDGTPFILTDYDPSQTLIQTGRNNLPISASYYDRVTQGTQIITFDYDNCGRGDGGGHHGNRKTSASSSGKSASTMNIKNKVRDILMMRSKNTIKEQIAELREQIQKLRK